MGYLVPTLLAFGLNSCGVNIFHESSKAGCEPLVSSLIFLFGVFLLLWDLRLFPASLRSLVKLAAITMHFFLSSFCMEHIMNDFWFPLETSLFAFLPKIAELETRMWKQFGWKSGGFLSFLKSDIAQVLASYALSLFFFVTVLHATRIIDLRLLRYYKFCFFLMFLQYVGFMLAYHLILHIERHQQRACGKDIFMEDLLYRFRRVMRKLYKQFTRRKVSFQGDDDDDRRRSCRK